MAKPVSINMNPSLTFTRYAFTKVSSIILPDILFPSSLSNKNKKVKKEGLFLASAPNLQ
jgi:hypothetical protein